MSHMDESCHIWMSHVTYGWVMSHMDDYHVRTSHINKSQNTSISPRAHCRLSSLLGTPGNESCHVWMTHYHSFLCDMIHICEMIHTESERESGFVALLESLGVCASRASKGLGGALSSEILGLLSEILGGLIQTTWGFSWVLGVPVSCDMMRLCVIWLVNTWHDSFLRDMTRLYGTWLVFMGHDSFLWDMIHSYVAWLICRWWVCIWWHDAFMCDVTCSCVTWCMHMRHDSLVCNMTHWYVT